MPSRDAAAYSYCVKNKQKESPVTVLPRWVVVSTLLPEGIKFQTSASQMHPGLHYGNEELVVYRHVAADFHV